MALQRLQRIIALSTLMLVAASAFSARKSSQLVRSSQCPSALNAGAVWMDEDAEDTYLMSRATACANSETCSLDEAESYLNDVLKAQRDCLDVTIANANRALCDDVAGAAEVVASLRFKIEAERKRLAPIKAVTNLANVAVGIYVVSAIVHGFAAVPNVPIDVPLYTPFEPLAEMNTRGVTSILPQEWMWAIRDGYFPSLFSEWFHHGGLVVDVSAFDSKAVAVTPQEWVWSVQNGFFGNLLEENVRYGGYHVDSAFDTEGMSPLNGQDVLYSIQGGYIGDMAKHFFRNGGL